MFLPVVTICLLSTMDQSVDCKHFNPDQQANTVQECVLMVGAFVNHMKPRLAVPHSIRYKCVDKSIRI